MRTRLGMLAIVALTALPALSFFPSVARADVVTAPVVASAGCFHRGFYGHGWHRHRDRVPRGWHRRW